MKVTFSKVAFFCIGLLLSNPASAENFGACNREIDKVKNNIQFDYEQWVDSVKDMPAEIRDAYIKIFTYNRDQAFLEADKSKDACYAELRPLQEIVDGVVAYYTLGLSTALPEKVFRVDVSEIMTGKPLGGPNAAVPQFRSSVFKTLGIDPKNPGTVGNIISDPLRCLFGKRKC